MLFKRHLFLLYLLSIAPFSYASNEIPGFFEVKYTLYSDGMKAGIMERQFFKQKDGNYEFRSETRTTGLISLFKKIHIMEESKWEFVDASFKPLLYKYQHSKNKKNREVEISFDWSKQKITNRVNDSVWHMDTEEGILDKLLYQLTIMSDLKSGTVPASYTIADGGKIKYYEFEHLTDEEIETPLGKFKTIKLARHKPNSKQETMLWCAYDLEFLPVKVINKEKDGRLTTAIIETLNGLGH